MEESDADKDKNDKNTTPEEIAATIKEDLQHDKDMFDGQDKDPADGHSHFRCLRAIFLFEPCRQNLMC